MSRREPLIANPFSHLPSFPLQYIFRGPSPLFPLLQISNTDILRTSTDRTVATRPETSLPNSSLTLPSISNGYSSSSSVTDATAFSSTTASTAPSTTTTTTFRRHYQCLMLPVITLFICTGLALCILKYSHEPFFVLWSIMSVYAVIYSCIVSSSKMKSYSSNSSASPSLNEKLSPIHSSMITTRFNPSHSHSNQHLWLASNSRIGFYPRDVTIPVHEQPLLNTSLDLSEPLPLYQPRLIRYGSICSIQPPMYNEINSTSSKYS